MKEERPVPESLDLTDESQVLEIRWSDEHLSRHRLSVLRSKCPCAGCQGHHPTQSLNLTPEQFPQICSVDMVAVGAYAYNIVWSDGHNTGIYTLEFLRELENSA